MNASPAIDFNGAARLPVPDDNVAIATRRLEAGTRITHEGETVTLVHTVMEGHRFVLRPIAAGEPLLSWGLPFGTALRDIAPGEYVCNASILEVLAERGIDFALPDAANFRDRLETYRLDETGFVPGTQVEAVASELRFEGLRRPGTRGVGTRNFIVVLATTSPSAAFAEALAARFEGESHAHPGLDGVVAVTHTEGGGEARPNNLDFVLRTLAGFMVHPNVAAVLAVDYGAGSFGNEDLRAYLDGNDYPIADVPHAFLSIEGALEAELDRAEQIVRGWIPGAGAAARTAEPLSELRVALQCGGSDAFSGISGNALAGWVAKEIIRHGGGANLAETDELIGAEPYVLSNVRDLDTARAFLGKIEIFKERARHHGASAEGNPSGGNKYRGLYNIALKSIGAARKRDPEVRLDHVIDYAGRMSGRGYYFMDSPGNDLESIAGQVASGCNLIFFITGNGSITNFPFVPTLKFVTTTGRFEMLANEMDVNAGRYNDGEPMATLGAETFDLALEIASGRRSKGELAGHAQVQIWREWQQIDDRSIAAIRAAAAPGGEPLATLPGRAAALAWDALPSARGPVSDQIGLIMPTSLCSGQVARLIAERLNARDAGPGGVTRYVALVHTEGCGSANADHLFLQTLIGHLAHPSTKRAVLLEHGCEKTHNDAVRHYLAGHGLGAGNFGWASVQLDGGIEKVSDKVAGWFEESLAGEPLPERESAGAGSLSLALLGFGPLPERTAQAFAGVALGVVAAGGTVVVPGNASLATSETFRRCLLASPGDWKPTLAYGQPAARAGLHVMEAPTENPVETLTGLGGTGAGVMVAHIGRAPLQAHPMIPLLQVASDAGAAGRYRDDLDLVLDTALEADELAGALLERIGEAASRRYTPRLFGQGITSFQLTRGLLGVSM